MSQADPSASRPSIIPASSRSLPKPDQTPWHAISCEQTLEKLDSSPEGLTDEQVAVRLETHGHNVLEQVSNDGILVILWHQINSPLIWVLIASAAVAMLLGKVTDGAVVLAVVVLNSIIGLIQEYRAGKAIEALRDMVPEYTNAVRNGHVQLVAVRDLVPGDIVNLVSGDKIPADVRLIASKNFRAEEAALTGESVPVEKSTQPVEIDANLGDRTCLAFKGTLVTYGTATAVVTETGGRTELGRISKMIQEVTELETPLTRALDSLGKIITIAILAVSAVILAFGVYRALGAGVEIGLALRETLIFAIALAVGAVPEGLPAIVTIALAIGVSRMAARRAIIRKLPAVETLGSTCVICSDKTGTLTRNEMTVHAVWTPSEGRLEVSGVGYDPTTGSYYHGITGQPKKDDDAAHEAEKKKGSQVGETVMRLLQDAALCNDGTLEQTETGWQITGDPTEGALVVAAEKAGIKVLELRTGSPRKDVVPFESENQFMATLHDDGEQKRVILKGAPEVIAPWCKADNGGADRKKLDLSGPLNEMTSEGMRVLAVAEKVWTKDHLDLNDPSIREGFTFCGLVGMIDPPREEAIDAVKACHRAGIEVKMITGDHEGTARAIGRKLGLIAFAGSGGELKSLQGKELGKLSKEQLRKVVKETSVFARVAPEHKLLIVQALQDEGNVVAMTGDGVNDAPALKQANIGVAMGITGTSVSKEAADMVLTDDNFATIVSAVEEGRRVYDNLIKSLAFVLPTNLGLAFILMYAVLFLPFDPIAKTLLLPVRPAQLLWINLVGAVALALPLAFEAKERNVMQRPPRDPNEPIMSRRVVRRTVLASLLMTVGAIGLFHLVSQGHLGSGIGDDSLAEAQTMTVTTVIFFQVFYLWNCRSIREPVWRLGLFTNPWVFVGIGITLALQAAFIYVPPFQRIFGTAPLDLTELALSFLAGVVVLPIISIEKWYSGRPTPQEKERLSQLPGALP